MKKVGIFYGSSTGDTEFVAMLIASKILNVKITMKDIVMVEKEDFNDCDIVILGVSTWLQTNLQYDFNEFLDTMTEIDISKKRFALFGLGDQHKYPDNFADGLGTLYNKLKASGAEVVGLCPVTDYSFNRSLAVVQPGMFAGLVIDEKNQRELTESRVNEWLNQLLPFFK